MRRCVLFLVMQLPCLAQGVITTVAGTDYIFPDDGKPALQAHLSTPYGLAFDSRSNLYFSDGGLNMVLKLDTSGIVSIVAGNGLPRFAGDGGPARAASLNTPWGLAFDGAGNLFIADSGASRVRKVDAQGVITTVAGGGTNSPGDGLRATQAALQQPAAVAFDPSGNLLIAERNGNRLRRVDASGVISTIAGTGNPGGLGDGGPAVKAQLLQPSGLAVASNGTIYVADSNNSRVRKIAPDGTITTFAGGGTDTTGNAAPATTLQLGLPSALALDPLGNLYLVEEFGARARRISTQGTSTNVAGTGVSGFSGDGGPALGATFNSIFGVTLDAQGNVYLADRLNGRIRRVDADGIVNTIAGAGRVLGDGGPAVTAVLAGADKTGTGGITTDAQGNIYIADTANQRVRKITPEGTISTVAGNGFLGPGTDGVQATSSKLQDPHGVAIDLQGNLFIGELTNNAIRKVTPAGVISSPVRGSQDANGLFHLTVDPAGNLYYTASSPTTGNLVINKLAAGGGVTRVAGNGTAGFSGDGFPAANASLGAGIPGCLATDAVGNLYFIDAANFRVRRVNPQGIITTIAGNGLSGNTGDGGPALNASLNFRDRNGLAVDAAGNVYIGVNGAIRRVGTDGIITTYAGNGKQGFSGDGGPAISASFGNTNDLAFTPQGNLVVWDALNQRIRLIQSGSGPSILPSQKGLTFIASSSGGGSPAPQSFTIVNGGQGTLNWSVSASTASGGNWLSVSPASGSSPAGGAGPPVQVTVNPTGLSSGDYYGQIQILGTGAPNSPQSITVVLTIRAPGDGTGSTVQPSGLLFTAAAGGATPANQSLTLTTLSTAAVSFTGTASFGAQSFFTLQPSSATTIAGKPATVQVVPNITGLARGVYNGNITFAFNDGSI